jgi:hypothetical protein
MGQKIAFGLMLANQMFPPALGILWLYWFKTWVSGCGVFCFLPRVFDAFQLWVLFQTTSICLGKDIIFFIGV